MKKIALIFVIIVTVSIVCCSAAFAVTNDVVKVGLYYGGSALTSANLENYTDTGSGYKFGYYNSDRSFVAMGDTAQTTISMSKDTNLYVASDGSYSTSSSSAAKGTIGCYHLQLNGAYDSYSEANEVAKTAKSTYTTAFPSYKNGRFYVMVGSYTTQSAASSALSGYGIDASVVSGTSDTVSVTVTGTTDIIFEFDGGGDEYLAIEPIKTSSSVSPQTWFKGYRYYGGFEYKSTSSGIQVVNVVNIEDYVKCVVVFEMSATWPAEAVKAQAVCARSYVMCQTKHSSYGFDVCSSTDCQVYRGASQTASASDACVDATAGETIRYGGKTVEAVFFSSDGGATESAKTVWGGDTGYLIGKTDPYEAKLSDYGVSIPSYTYTSSYTSKTLGTLLTSKGFIIGTVNKIVITPTATGNMGAATFYDTNGKSVTVPSTKMRSVFSTRSQRFGFTADDGSISTAAASSSKIYVNSSSASLSSLSEAYTISGSGAVSSYSGSSAYVITSSGTETLGETTAADNSTLKYPTASYTVNGTAFTLYGSGYGHNVGMSQYGAYAMAKIGNDYEDILKFYYTDITVE